MNLESLVGRYFVDPEHGAAYRVTGYDGFKNRYDARTVEEPRVLSGRPVGYGGYATHYSHHERLRFHSHWLDGVPTSARYLDIRPR